MFAQPTYKHAVLLTTLSLYSRLSTQSPGQPFGSSGVCSCSTHPVSSQGPVCKAKTPCRHLQSRIIPEDCSAHVAGLLSTCLLQILFLTSHKPSAPQPPSSSGGIDEGSGSCPTHRLCIVVPAWPGGLGEPGWQSPRQWASSCSTYQSHFF